LLRRFYSNFYGCGCRLVWERVWTQHVSLGLVQEGGELEQLGAELAGNLSPLRCCGVGIILGERCGNAGGDDAPPALPAYANALRMKWTRHRCQPALNILRTVALMPYASRSICPSATFGT
jgi:hypothetical protein